MIPSMVTPPGKKQGLILGNSERNCPLKPESRHTSPSYAEPADAITHKAVTISKGQLRNDTASDKDRHNEAGWLHTHAVVNPNPLHPIEWKESEQTKDRISLVCLPWIIGNVGGQFIIRHRTVRMKYFTSNRILSPLCS